MDRIKALLEMVEDDPSDSLARFMLGQELLKADRPEEAADHLREAIRLSPEHTASYRYLGSALEGTGCVDDAVEVYEKGLVVAEETGDLQTGREIRVFLNRIKRA